MENNMRRQVAIVISQLARRLHLQCEAGCFEKRKEHFVYATHLATPGVLGHRPQVNTIVQKNTPAHKKRRIRTLKIIFIDEYNQQIPHLILST